MTETAKFKMTVKKTKSTLKTKRKTKLIIKKITSN
jgi:hypothetical protein